MIDKKKIDRDRFSKHMIRENEEFLDGEGKWEYGEKATSLLGKDIPDLPNFGCVKCKHFRNCDVWEEGHCLKWERDEA